MRTIIYGTLAVIAVAVAFEQNVSPRAMCENAAEQRYQGDAEHFGEYVQEQCRD